MQIPVNSSDIYLQTYITRTTNNSLPKEEKPSIIALYNNLISKHTILVASAAGYGLNSSSEKLAYDTAVTSLTNYLSTLTIPILWDNTSGMTLLSNRDVFEGKFYTVNSTQKDLELLINMQLNGEDLTTPPMPSGLVTSSKFASIVLSWTPTTYPNLSHTEIWRSDTSVFSSAVVVGGGSGSGFTDRIDTTVPMYYWIRFISKANIAGPFNSSVGTSGAVGIDPTYILSILDKQITSSHLDSILNDKLLNVPANTAELAFLEEMQNIETLGYNHAATSILTSGAAMVSTVERLNTENSNFESATTTYGAVMDGLYAENYVKVDVNGLLSGYGVHSDSVGSSFVIKASNFGFAIPGHSNKYAFIIANVNGTTSVGIHGNLVIDGSLKATSIGVDNLAAIKANLGTATAGDIYAASIHGGTGYTTNAYVWPAAGKGGYSLSEQGLIIGNKNDNKYFQANAAGDTYTPGFSTDANGNSFFAGTLNSASGRFAGAIYGGGFSSYSWPANNEGGFYLGPEGLLLGNYNNGTIGNKYFQMTTTGDIYSPGFNVNAGVLSINQLDVIDTLNIRNQAVTTPVSIGGTTGPQNIYNNQWREAGTAVFTIDQYSDVIVVITWNTWGDSMANEAYRQPYTILHLMDAGVETFTSKENHEFVARYYEDEGWYWNNSRWFGRGGSGNTPHVFSAKKSLTAGTHAFTLGFSNESPYNYPYSVRDWNMTILLAKR